jgi:hypothetical protein
MDSEPAAASAKCQWPFAQCLKKFRWDLDSGALPQCQSACGLRVHRHIDSERL